MLRNSTVLLIPTMYVMINRKVDSIGATCLRVASVAMEISPSTASPAPTTLSETLSYQGLSRANASRLL